MFNQEEVEEHVRKKAALFGDRPLDYVSLHVGAKYSQQLATVQFGDRALDDSINELVMHLQDAAQEAADEGRSWCKVRAKFWRNKQPAGSRVFATEGAPSGMDDENQPRSREEALLARDSELIAALRETRMLAQAAVADLGAQSQSGWRMATQLANQNQALLARNAELQAEVIKAQLTMKFADKPDEIQEMVKMMLPTLLSTLMAPRPERTAPAPAPAALGPAPGAPSPPPSSAASADGHPPPAEG